jgi:glutaredoxin-related protein
MIFQVPQLFIDGKYIGGEKEITRMHSTGDLGKILVTAGALKD